MPSANKLISDFLKSQGLQPTSAVTQHLCAEGYGEAAARKAIERIRDPVRKLSGLRLPNRQRVLYLSGQYRRGDFWDQLLSVLHAAGSIYGIALAGLDAYGGSVSEDHFVRTSGSPKRLKGQVGAERVLAVLRDVGFLEYTQHDPLGQVVRFARSTGFHVQPYSRLRARLMAECVLLAA
jgi:hypothetical protein